MAEVSPEWAGDRACPRCGRPLRWIGRWEGERFVREAFVTTHDERIAPDDRKVRKVVRRGGRERVEDRYEHESVLQCAWCSRQYSLSQAHVAPPPEPEEAPAGFYAVAP